MTGKPRGQQEKTDRDLIMARWTGVVGIFTAALAVISLVTAVIFWRQLSVMQGQLDITKRALVAVERPILLLTMNSAFVFEAGHPRFEIKIQNVGKQIGLITGVTASFVSQDDTIPPPPSQPFKDDGSACVIHTGDGHYMIGETVIVPNDSIIVYCNRQRIATTSELQGILDRVLFGFVSISVIYSDPIGFTRIAEVKFLIRPSGQFVRAFDTKSVIEFPASDQAEIQRQLFGGTLRTETDNEKKSGAHISH